MYIFKYVYIYKCIYSNMYIYIYSNMYIYIYSNMNISIYIPYIYTYATVVFSPVPAVYTNVSRCSPSTQGTARPSASPSHQKVASLPDVAT